GVAAALRVFEQSKDQFGIDQRFAAEEAELQHAAARQLRDRSIDRDLADVLGHPAVELRAGVAVPAAQVAGVIDRQNQAEAGVHATAPFRARLREKARI